MLHFECDYTQGAHPKVMEMLQKTNMEQTAGYGEDPYCEAAKELICSACGKPDADVHFLVGGTQTNATIIASVLRPYQGVLCAETGHINVHETGAIESKGHKVLPIQSFDGKITGMQIREMCEQHFQDVNHEHMVQPGMVYISFPTENGTIYSKAELEEISIVCQQYGLPLFIDGARLGYGLMADGNDLTLEDITDLCDVFYIGGTKVGTLFGEAVVFPNPDLARDFRYLIKQNGGMLAKGRLLGIQFLALFEDNTYFKIARHADELAMQIKNALKAKGYQFLYDSNTNQQFPILPDVVVQQLEKKYVFSFWQKVGDNHTAVRFCTSWGTKAEEVNQLVMDILR
ncbi:MAG: low specificity L-threonine aldolase [Hespellia sp.]|nr:low specificity L-threonine aldolase [Hespellia sp.]